METGTTEAALRERLRTIVHASPRTLAILRVARTVDAPHWAVGAGTIRNLVWDHLHGLDSGPPRDVDLVYWNPSDLSAEADVAVAGRLTRALPGVAWEAVNQAAVHRWYRQADGRPPPPLDSVEAGIATWPETCTAVAVRLDHRDDLHVIAPFGLADLFALVLRHNPSRAGTEEFQRRIASKGWLERWPRLRVVR